MPNTEQKPLIMTLIDERVIRCPNCHSTLHWTGRNAQCQEGYTIFISKNGAIDLYGRYKEQCSDNVVVSNRFVEDVAKSLGFSNDKGILNHIADAVRDTYLVSIESDSLTAGIRELAMQLKIPPPIGPFKNRERHNNLLPNSNVKIIFEEHFIDSKLCANESIYRSIRIKNVGKSPLSSEGQTPLLISYHWLDDSGNIEEFDGILSPIPKILYPQESVTVLTRIKTPEHKGKYILRFCLLHECVRWIEDNVLDIPVEVAEKIHHSLEDVPIYCQDFDFNSDQDIAKQMISSYINENHQNKKLRILEIGAGIFPQAICLTKLNCEVISADISFAMCQLGSLFYSYVDSNYDKNLFCFIACDALNTPFATSSFGGSVIFAALHHFPDPVNLLLYLKKLVKKDGFFAIMRELCNPNPCDPDYLRDLCTDINEQMWSIEEYSYKFDEARLKLDIGCIDSKCSLKVILVPDDYKRGFDDEEKNRYLL
jgi:SAM-dependent methyltransferase/uncharacterized protein YcfL